NRHRCFRKSRFIFLSTPLSISHCTRPYGHINHTRNHNAAVASVTRRRPASPRRPSLPSLRCYHCRLLSFLPTFSRSFPAIGGVAAAILPTAAVSVLLPRPHPEP
uniref:Uncharacterized protein n=1 Tax=Aegilops tauschii subsp. strangulata TaxID=200361 RepID=A0A453BXG4_AEGTS